MSAESTSPHLPPFTVLVTVPKGLVPADASPDTAFDPLLTKRFGWSGYQLVPPGDDVDAYDSAMDAIRERETGARVDVLDHDRALLRITRLEGPDVGAAPDSIDVFLRVVRLFPKGRMLDVVGEA